MRKNIVLILFLCVSLLVLSSCYSVSEVNQLIDEKEQQWADEYADLEEKYYESAGNADTYETALSSIYDYILTVRSYFEDTGSLGGITEDIAKQSVDQICQIFNDLGY